MGMRHLFLLLLSLLTIIPFTVGSYACTPTNAVVSSVNGPDPSLIAESGCKLLGKCKRATSDTALLRRQTFMCPDGFGCYILQESGLLYCLNLQTWDFITPDGACGNVLTGAGGKCGGDIGGNNNGNVATSTAAIQETGKATGTSSGAQKTGQGSATSSTGKSSIGIWAGGLSVREILGCVTAFLLL